MSDLIARAKSSKLRTNSSQDENHRIVRKIVHKDFPRSYRLDSEIMNTLKVTLDRVNDISPKKVSEARLVKSLILLSKDIEDSKIMKALKEVW